MKSRNIAVSVALAVMLHGCNPPETIVTNIVHPDGSVTRRVEMRSSTDSIRVDQSRVPIDTTWLINDYVEISEEGDTTFVMTAEKLFQDAEEINEEYRKGNDVNSFIKRSVCYERRFRWFVTYYRFSERFEKTIEGGLPLKDYLEVEEMEFLALPDFVSGLLLEGPDSLRYRALSERIDSVVSEWFRLGLISSFIHNATGLLEAEGADWKVIEEFRSKEAELAEMYVFDIDTDSIVGIVFRKIIEAGYRGVIDSALMVVSDGIDRHWSIRSYTLKSVMPGKLKGGNGYFENPGEVAWQVKGELFLFDEFEFWAESYLQNIWAWVVSGVIVLIVVSGLLPRRLSRRQ